MATRSVLTSLVKVPHITRRLKAQRWVLATLERRTVMDADVKVEYEIKKLIHRAYRDVKSLEAAEFNHKRARGKLLMKLTKEQRDDSRNQGKTKFVRD